MGCKESDTTEWLSTQFRMRKCLLSSRCREPLVEVRGDRFASTGGPSTQLLAECLLHRHGQKGTVFPGS